MDGKTHTHPIYDIYGILLHPFVKGSQRFLSSVVPLLTTDVLCTSVLDHP